MINCVLQIREQIGTPYPMEWDALFYHALDLIYVDVAYTARNNSDVFAVADLIMDKFDRHSSHLTYSISIGE